MTKRASVCLSAIGAAAAGLAAVVFYSRGILPLTGVYVPKNEIGYHLIYSAAAVAGAFLLAAALKRKKPVFWIGAGLLLLGIPLFFYAVSRPPFDYAPIRLRIIGRSLIPAAFALLAVFALKGFRAALGLLFAAFSALGLYHAVLTVKLIARGGRPADIAIALALAAVSFFFAWTGLRALRRRS